MPKIHRYFGKYLLRFVHIESSSSLVLGLSAIVAMVLANSPWSTTYFHWLEFKVAGLSVQHWINDGLMAIFFFVVGMEIKREIVVGELSSLKKAALPVSAAIGGMLVPALIYFMMNPEGDAARGWAIPMATDIAFALGVLTLFGKRVPLSLKVFLLALAIVDDLGAVFVIAAFYTEEIKFLGLAIAAAGIAATLGMRVAGVKSYFPYIPVGAVLWMGVLYSGVHATIAGIVLGFLTPFTFAVAKRSAATFSPLENLIHWLHPWVSFFIMPVFALANAGIPLAGISFTAFANDPVAVGVAGGLIAGKPVGIVLASLLAVSFGFAQLPAGMRWPHIFGVASLAGIGFTMAIFITNLALAPAEAINAKSAILAASAISGLIGYVVLRYSLAKGLQSDRGG